MITNLFSLAVVGEHHHKASVPYGWIMGSLGVGLVVIVVVVLLFVSLSHAKDQDEKSSHKFQILRNRSFCCGSGRYLCCKPGDIRHSQGESSDRKINIPKGSALSLLHQISILSNYALDV